MDRAEMIAKLNRKDISGVGAITTWKDGIITYNFYEDFKNNKGIDRASRHASMLIEAGEILKREYIHKSINNIYFVDWEAEKGTFCMNDFFVRYNKAHNYKYYYDHQEMITEWTPQLKVIYDYKGAIHGISEVIYKAI